MIYSLHMIHLGMDHSKKFIQILQLLDPKGIWIHEQPITPTHRALSPFDELVEN